MGLRDELLADIAEAFDNDLADAVKEFTGVRKATGEYNPSTGKMDNTPLSYTGRGVFASYKLENIDNSLIQAKDQKLTVLQTEISVEPQINDLINGYKVIRVSFDPAAVTFNIQLRA